MSEFGGILLMMNNYFHDVATALLLASGVAGWVLFKACPADAGREAAAAFIGMYRRMTRLAVFALVWIILGGIPRTLFYRQFEWAHAAGRGQIPALMVKHVLAFVFVGAGAVLWRKLGRRVRAMKEGTPAAEDG